MRNTERGTQVIRPNVNGLCSNIQWVGHLGPYNLTFHSCLMSYHVAGCRNIATNYVTKKKKNATNASITIFGINHEKLNVLMSNYLLLLASSHALCACLEALFYFLGKL